MFLKFSQLSSGLILTAFLAGLIFISPLPAQAADDCNVAIKNKLDYLLKIKDAIHLIPEVKVERELKARQNLLSEIISCSQKEVTATQNKLNDLNLESSTERDLKDALLENLNSFQKHYTDTEKYFSLHRDNSDEIKQLASDLLSWRQETYNPELSSIIDFIFTVKQRTIIKTAAERLSKIRTSLKTLLSLENDTINKLLDQAEASILSANDLNTEAGQIIIDSLTSVYFPPTSLEPLNFDISSSSLTLSPASSTLPAPTKDIKPTTTSSFIETEATVIEPTNPRALIKESLDDIKQTYQNFFSLSNVIQELLGY